MIVTLAGHVDHGKTSLVNALTGVNTDRLAQEKARGLTIDLGFAYIDGGQIGFVDVPGHQKFIHNMVAGVASDQFALLVVAADDGPMPQSKEHLEILSLVGVSKGLIAMTKCDRVNEDRLVQCEDEIRSLGAESFLKDAPILRTSVELPESIDHLLTAIRAARQDNITEGKRPFRLAIDRSFTVRGSGVVVTGTAHSGHIETGTELYHWPSGKTVRARSIHVQNAESTHAARGDRCALNISGLDLNEVRRGDWLTETPSPASTEITIELNVLNDFPRAIKQWTPVHIYHATSHATGHIALHSGSRMAPGNTKLVDLICDEPLTVCHGDNVIIRDYGLDTTLGGGRVVFASETISTRRRTPQRLAMLSAYNQLTPQAVCATLLEAHTFPLQDFQSVWQLNDTDTETILTNQGAIRLSGYAISKNSLGQFAKVIVDRVSDHLEDNASSRGLKVDAFKDIPGPVLHQVLSALVQNNRLTVFNGVYGLPTHQIKLPEALQPIWERAEKALNNTQPPSSGDLAKAWNQSQPAIQKSLKELARRGYLIQIADHRFYLPDILNEISAQVVEMADPGPFTVREFRDSTGIGRNVAIDILEYFDAKGFTRREGNHRKLLRKQL